MGLERVVRVVVAFMRSMTVAVVKIVDMVFVLDCGVAAVWTVLVLVLLGLVVAPACDPTSQGVVWRRDHEARVGLQDDGATRRGIGIERRSCAAHPADIY